MTNFYQSHAGWPQVRVVDELPTEPTEPPVGGVPAWDATSVYVKDDRVSYEGLVFKAKWWTQGDTPVAGGWGPWQLVQQ